MRTTHHVIAAIAAASILGACQQTAEAPKITMPTAAEHSSRYFPINVDPHQWTDAARTTRSTCSTCHTSDTTSFLQVNCIGCHTQGTAGNTSTLLGTLLVGLGHQSPCSSAEKGSGAMCFPPGQAALASLPGVDQVAWSGKCVLCHPLGTKLVDRATHGFFPIQTGTQHGAIDCAQCHVTSASPPALDYSKFDCVSCHSGLPAGQGLPALDGQSQHNGVPFPVADAVGTSPQCYTCHSDGTTGGITRAAHSTTNYLIDTGSAHATVACSDCHGASRDVADLKCASCHSQGDTDARHGHSSAYSYTMPTSCNTCHVMGAVASATSVDRDFPIGKGSKHEFTSSAKTASMTCDDCHGTDRTNVSQLKCKTCHQSGATANVATAHAKVKDYLNAAVTGESAAPLSCLQCHYLGMLSSGSIVQHVDSSHPSFSDGGDTQTITGGKHSPSTWGCLYCHPYLKTSPSWENDFSRHDCDACHALHRGN